MHLQELKAKSPADLLAYAEDLEIENASTLRKQDMMFAILKQLADNDVAIYGSGVLEVLSDGFGFLRAPESNYLPGPDDIYVSPSQVRRFGLRTGDLVDGALRSPKDKERFFALHFLDKINNAPPEQKKKTVPFENLTPLFPDERLVMETGDPKEISRNYGSQYTAVKPPSSNKTINFHQKPASIKAIELLLQKPEIALSLTKDIQVLTKAEDEGRKLLLSLIEMVRGDPRTDVYTMLGYCYGSKLGNKFTQIFRDEKITPKDGLEEEFIQIVDNILSDMNKKIELLELKTKLRSKVKSG